MIVLDGIETVNPLGADIVTTKLDELQPTSLLKTSIAYLSCWPAVPHDPGDAHAQVLSIEARGAFSVHPDVGALGAGVLLDGVALPPPPALPPPFPPPLPPLSARAAGTIPPEVAARWTYSRGHG